MSRADRRTVLRYAGAALLLPVPAWAAEAPRFAPGAAPMLYTRRLERALGGGERFVVDRSFRVLFVPEGGGYRVVGEQVGVEVEAPEALAEFARIERERREAGLFPLLLDGAGGIADGEGIALATKLDEAVREALAELERRGGGGTAERAEQVRFVTAFHQGASRLLTELPRDLFAPVDTPRRETRRIALPGGDAGEVTVTFAATRDPSTGVMREASREVVTALDGERRRTLESWSLAPL